MKSRRASLIRNITFVAPCDVTPVWDSSEGRWNSEFDSIYVYSASRIWALPTAAPKKTAT